MADKNLSFKHLWKLTENIFFYLYTFLLILSSILFIYYSIYYFIFIISANNYIYFTPLCRNSCYSIALAQFRDNCFDLWNKISAWVTRWTLPTCNVRNPFDVKFRYKWTHYVTMCNRYKLLYFAGWRFTKTWFNVTMTYCITKSS